MKIYRHKRNAGTFYMVRFQRRASDGMVLAVMLRARRVKGKFRPIGVTFSHEAHELHRMGFSQVC